MIRGMNTISISPFLRPTTDTFTEVMNATGQTYINNRPHDGSVTTLVVVGHRLEHPEALDRLVTAAVAGFRDEPIARQPQPQPLTPGEKKKKIAELRRWNEQSPACRYSRQCNICFSSSPTSRAVLTACGHSLCMACVLQMEVDGRLDCPYCRKPGGYVKLHEEKETGEERKQVASAIASLTLAPSSDNVTQSAPRPTLLNASAPEFVPAFSRWDTTTQRLQSPDPTLITPFVNTPSSTAPASFNPTIPPPIVSRTTLTVYIGNLNPSTTERELRELFSIAGEVRNIALPIHRVTGLGRGFGFCNFLNESSAQNAVDLFNGKNGLICAMLIGSHDIPEHLPNSRYSTTKAYSYFSNFVNGLLDAFVPLKVPKSSSGYPKFLSILHDRLERLHSAAPNCDSTHMLRARFNKALKTFEIKRESDAIHSVLFESPNTPMISVLPLPPPSGTSFDIPYISIEQILVAISQLVPKVNGSPDKIPNLVYTKSYKIYIRPLLESSTVIWNPTAIGLVNRLESVQREFTRCVLWRSHLPYFPYPQRLEHLQLETLEYRRALNDMYFLFDSVNGFVHLDTSNLYSIAPFSRHRVAHPEALDRLVTAAVAGFRDEPIARQPEPQPLTPGEKKKKIAELRRRDEQSPACRYSRQCNICFSSSPTSRAVLTACGHSLCMACVLQMEVDGRLDCPYCRKPGGYVKLHEEKETGEERKQVASAIASLTLAPSSDNDTQSAPRPTLLNASAPEFVPAFPRWDTTTQRLQSPDPTLITPFVNTPSSTAPASFNPTIPPPIVSRTTLTVYIGNLNPSTTERELRELFSIAGEVRNIALPIHRVTGLGRGFGFCNFLNESSAQNAVDLFNGKNGLIVRLKY
ncbi:hypothetical protein PRIPAC_76215 [Pristionchus pacificus]|uniref:RNA binding protein n=1 Tax=Pristionchus pacificus TaxID=54126 RepID=A0A2A6C799_PRIPA|nr:hypothetical protein PRIPAC_76215 [Pristionchus pacificus]|eukprot:PDM73976.1 RNA binding protein [Pristionchus pacificus]